MMQIAYIPNFVLYIFWKIRTFKDASMVYDTDN